MWADSAVALELFLPPIKTRNIAGFCTIFKDAIAKVSELAAVGNILCVESIHLDLAGLVKDYFGGEVLLRWCILG